jgi:hypothetical protein
MPEKKLLKVIILFLIGINDLIDKLKNRKVTIIDVFSVSLAIEGVASSVSKLIKLLE